MNRTNLTLGQQLGEDDWALIIGSDGNLKGIFIPVGKEEEEVPESIVSIMSHYFGVDLNQEIEETSSVPPDETVH